MNRLYDLLVVGEINPDLILQGKDLEPGFGQAEKLVESAVLAVGSSSVITACGASQLGLRTAFVGVVGDDVFGRFMLDAMHSYGVDTSCCRVDKALRTGFSVILSQPHDRAILTYSGSISRLTLTDIDMGVLQQARHLHVGSFFLLDGLRDDLPELFKEAKKQGLSTSLDTNWDPTERWDGGLEAVWQVCDVFLPNEAEACRVTNTDGLEEALNVLSNKVPLIGVKAGARGGILRQGSRTVKAPPLDIDVVDTTGAGDAFNAGFIFGHLHGWPLDKTLSFACACGSLSTRGVGGVEFQPTYGEVERALDKIVKSP